jgi:hypothetical protein
MDRENIYEVPKKTWNSWSVLSRQLFNSVYGDILQMDGELFFGPTYDCFYHDEALRVSAWNAAWIAAERLARPDVKTNVELIESLEEA